MSRRRAITDHFSPRNDLDTIRTLLPYLWPRGKPALRARVVMAVGLIVAAKATTVAVPVFYKFAVDALTSPAVVVVPVALLVAYGVARVMAQAFGELRDAVFARVAQRAIREAGLKTFRHLPGR